MLTLVDQLSLKVNLASIVQQNELSFSVEYKDSISLNTDSRSGITAGVRPITLIFKPGGVIRYVYGIWIKNLDVVPSTVTISYYDNNVFKVQVYSVELLRGQTLVYSKNSGFTINDPASFEEKIYKQATAPSNPKEGALWIETET